MKYLAIALLLPFSPAYTQAPPVMLATSYEQQSVVGWLASEKLDGVRGYWDGKQLLSRQGTIFPAPADFIADFPDFPLDGELYSGRGKFAETSGNVRSGKNWSKIRYHVFDVPYAQGGLRERLAVLEKWLAKHPNSHIVIVEQTPIANIDDAIAMREKIEQAGGEGVMLRNPDTPYLPTRTETLLKLKSHQDAECIVRSHLPGKGRLIGKLGSLVCELSDGRQIKIGSGFTDSERTHPPAIGTTITYRYNGYTKTGKPRFVRFWRIREGKQ